MAKNEFLPFGTAANANVLPSADYQALPARSAGFSSGVAKSEELNTVWRQGSTMAAVLGQFIADKTGQDVLDDGNIAGLASQLGGALSLFTSLTGVLDKNGYISIPVNISGVIKNLLIQWGSGAISASTGTANFSIPFNTTPFIVIPHKITSDNRYVTSTNYTKTGFQLNAWSPSSDNVNIDSYSYISIGW
ncbi:hypothetical protein P9A10_16830 [Serratia marcescens]|uniref:gp53-like domain-containing protein n=1 Tax=Serratia marcescens TaxID=615 RepID=UPI0032049E88